MVGFDIIGKFHQALAGIPLDRKSSFELAVSAIVVAYILDSTVTEECDEATNVGGYELSVPKYLERAKHVDERDRKRGEEEEDFVYITANAEIGLELFLERGLGVSDGEQISLTPSGVMMIGSIIDLLGETYEGKAS